MYSESTKMVKKHPTCLYDKSSNMDLATNVVYHKQYY
jgi:hypothetical protein